MRLLPRDRVFFDLFTQQARVLTESAALLFDGAKGGGESLARASRRIGQREREGDKLVHSAA